MFFACRAQVLISSPSMKHYAPLELVNFTFIGACYKYLAPNGARKLNIMSQVCYCC